jgi:hypothetical protein
MSILRHPYLHVLPTTSPQPQSPRILSDRFTKCTMSFSLMCLSLYRDFRITLCFCAWIIDIDFRVAGGQIAESSLTICGRLGPNVCMTRTSNWTSNVSPSSEDDSSSLRALTKSWFSGQMLRLPSASSIPNRLLISEAPINACCVKSARGFRRPSH